ncbi:MAG: hypothetical protein B5766_02345 [Candidatus Lumbricidophila eiseniae]|uniref:Apiosidase-like catalytic domain-containing protein n=1 Tax=Candidatus Lumbricidiphila eiseniae TaxID=1969409 RepID=A0A2A6FTQ7_9MICO|nr:MAG: hypothetical protein B5766_02345 [Candidatus Lumbricidophila eiseniae]
MTNLVPLYGHVDVPIGLRERLRDHISPTITHVDPNGLERTVPCYWSGEEWYARVHATAQGSHRLRSDILGAIGEFEAGAPENSSVLARSGPLVRDRDTRHTAHRDGTPFLWLGDTWWHGLGDRVTDGEFSELARHRAAQGFNAVQIVAGLNVDVEVFSPLGASLAGWPWTEGFGDINHAWWQGADKRILALVNAGLVPVIFGAWGYYLTWMSDEHMMAHWREIIARWSALPVVWCVAGEVTLPYYPNPMREVTSAEREELRGRWLRIAEYVRDLDPYARLLTAHPAPASRDYATSETFPGTTMDTFDIDILQTGHSGTHSLEWTRSVFDRAMRRGFTPVINVEVNYEGIAGGSDDTVQRFLWWSHILAGASGFTYGSQGLWGFEDETYQGLTGSWGRTQWRDAASRPGASHLGAARNWLAGRDWAALVPMSDGVRCARNIVDSVRPCAAELPSGELLMYLPALSLFAALDSLQTLSVSVRWSNYQYRITFIDPRTFTEELGYEVTSDRWSTVSLKSGMLSAAPSMEDWLVVVAPRSDAGAYSDG